MLNTLTSSPDSVDQLVQALRVLCDGTRLRLLSALQSGEMNVTSLCKMLDLPQPTVSHHLGLLRGAKLVTNRRDGKQVFYGLNDEFVSNLGDHGGVKIHAGDIALQILTEQGKQHTADVEVKPAQPALHNGANGI